MNAELLIWGDVCGYEGKYQVSSDGKYLKSLNRIIIGKNGKIKTIKEKFLKQSIDKDGYIVYTLHKHGKPKTLKMARLVALSFIPNPNNFPQVNHKDGNKQNNHVENLEWCTNHQNILHAINTGLLIFPKGNQCHRYKGDILVFKNGMIIDRFRGRADMVAKGYHKSHVYDCLNGKAKSHKGCTFAWA